MPLDVPGRTRATMMNGKRFESLGREVFRVIEEYSS